MIGWVNGRGRRGRTNKLFYGGNRVGVIKKCDKIDHYIKLIYFSAGWWIKTKPSDGVIDHPIAEVVLEGFCLNRNSRAAGPGERLHHGRAQFRAMVVILRLPFCYLLPRVMIPPLFRTIKLSATRPDLWLYSDPEINLRKISSNTVTILNASPLTTRIIVAFFPVTLYLLCCYITVTLQTMIFLYTQNRLLCSVAVTFAAVH